MNRAAALETLKAHKAILCARFGVTRLTLFGSTARDTATETSDVDVLVLVDFDGAATSERYFGVQFYLEDLLGRRVDLVTEKALRERAVLRNLELIGEAATHVPGRHSPGSRGRSLATCRTDRRTGNQRQQLGHLR